MNIDYRKLARYKGQTLTAKEILKICGYSSRTSINDTYLAHNNIITPIRGTFPTRWVISEQWHLFGL